MTPHTISNADTNVPAVVTHSGNLRFVTIISTRKRRGQSRWATLSTRMWAQRSRGLQKALYISGTASAEVRRPTP